MTSKSTALWIRLWPVYVILLGLGLALSQGWHEYLTLDALSANAVSLDAMVKENFLIVFAGYILIYAAATTFMVPGSALTIAGGFLFGLVIGTPATVIGATIGASILFFASKTSIGASPSKLSSSTQLAAAFAQRHADDLDRQRRTDRRCRRQPC